LLCVYLWILILKKLDELIIDDGVNPLKTWTSKLTSYGYIPHKTWTTSSDFFYLDCKYSIKYGHQVQFIKFIQNPSMEIENKSSDHGQDVVS